MKRGLFSLFILIIFVGILSAQANVSSMKISPSEIPAGSSGKALITFTIPEGYHQSYEPGVNDFFFADPQPVKGIEFKPTIYPTGKKDENGIITYYKNVTLTVPFKVASAAKEGKLSIKINTGWQHCLETGSCLMPDEKVLTGTITVTANPNGAVAQTEQVTDTAAVKQAQVQEQPVQPTEPVKQAPIGKVSILKFLLMGLIGGLILNVMPCVLPVLSIKAMSIVKQSHEDHRQIMQHSFIYVLGVMVSFLILAIIVIVLKTVGTQVGWGFQFQNPIFVVVLTAFIFLFALSLFDVFIIQMPGMNFVSNQSTRKGLAGSFMSGVFAVVLATPCTAPFLGAALGFAFSQPSYVILPMFLFIGLGLSLPFIIIGFNPKSIKIFPKPGEWMNIFKEAMGFLLLATVVWLLDVLFNQVGGENLIRYIIFLLCIGFAAWLYGRFSKPEHPRHMQWLFFILSIVVIVVSGSILLKFKPYDVNATVQNQTEEWQPFNPDKVNQLTDQGIPVFIDFTAKWCMTCKVNENTVLYSKEIKEALKDKKVSLFRADYTNGDKLIAEWLKRYNRAGVPLYILYVPGNKEPIVMPEVLTKQIVMDALGQIKDAGN
ncbi:MAG TPA: thioredoxin family protein [Candidatus Cloacimonadota bacterium]|nr:thioredoxin family protein [Candidatus Cloacimonadota bacterium]HPT71285.1 thioredoxin family protein [Candidatus Cloacimonadota bacterium]